MRLKELRKLAYSQIIRVVIQTQPVYSPQINKKYTEDMGLFRRSRKLWAKLYPPPQKVFVIVQSLSHVQLFATPWTVAHQASPSSTISQSLLKLMSTELVILSNYIILCCPFFSCPQSFPASDFFPVSQLFTSGGPSIEASTSASVLPMNIQDQFPLRLNGLVSFLSKGLSRVFSSIGVVLFWIYVLSYTCSF